MGGGGVRVEGGRLGSGVSSHTVDYGPFIESQFASTQLTSGPYVMQNW